MKTMKKSALAAAVLLSLSMMSSVYAEENYTDPIIVNAGETFTVGQDYDNVKIVVNDVDGVFFYSVLVDGVGYVPVDKDGKQVEGAKSTLLLNPKGDILISAGGNPISCDATTGIWTWDGTGTENVYAVKTGTDAGGTTAYLGSPNIVLKAENITLKSGPNADTRGIGFFPSSDEYKTDSCIVIEGKDSVYIEGSQTGLYASRVKDVEIDGNEIMFYGGKYAVQCRNGTILNIGQNESAEQVTLIGNNGDALTAKANNTIVNINAEKIYISAKGTNKKGIMADSGALVNIVQDGFKGDGINIVATHPGVQATGSNTVVNLKGSQVTLAKNGTTAGKHGGVNITTGAKVVFMADTERQSAISVGGQIDVMDADSTLVFDLANGVAGDSVTINGKVINAGIINLDFDDNAKDTMTTTSTWDGTGTTNINFDIDLANTANSDAITIGGMVTNQTLFKLGRINIMADGDATSYQLITRGSGDIEFNTVKVIKNDIIYTFSDSGSKNGSIKIAKDSTTPITLSGIISGDYFKEVSNYALNSDTVADAALGKLNGANRELTIEGNGNEIDGNNKAGVTVGKDQILTLMDLSMNGFSGNAITNKAGGTVNTQGDFYADKVKNNGTMNTSGFAYIDELAMGEGATVKVDGQLFSDTVTAIGSNNTMGAAHTYALGEDNKVMGEKSVAVGFANEVNGKGSGAFGDPNVVYGDGSYAFGNDNKIGTAEKHADNSFAVGNNTTVSGNGSVVLGNGSTATEDNVVSVGSETQQRKIVNVKAGEVDTDAATVGQMKSAVGDAFTGADGSKGLKYDSTDNKLVANVPLSVTDGTVTTTIDASGVNVGGDIVKVGVDTENDLAGLVMPGADETKYKVALGSALSADTQALMFDVDYSNHGAPASALSLGTGLAVDASTKGNGLVVKGLDNNADVYVGSMGTSTDANTGLQVTTTDKGSVFAGAYADGVGVVVDDTHGMAAMDGYHFKLSNATGTSYAEMLQSGLTVTNGTTTVNFGVNGISAGGQNITNVANGSLDTDAATYGQVKNAVTASYSDNVLTLHQLADGSATTNDIKIDLGGLVTGTDKEITVTKGTGTDAGKQVVGLDEKVKNDISALQTAVGGTDSGLVKDVADLKTTVGDSSSGLVKNVTALQTTVGDSSKGLVKNVTDIQKYVKEGGLDANGKKITNVADGKVAEGSTDAVNGGQLYEVDKKIEGIIGGDITELENKVDSLGTRINKVGAGAAALAAMHPVYDEDSKLTFSAGLGAYRNEKAAAVGMFYRFSPRVMMNAGATVGNDNNMYNVGLNFALDRHVRGGLPSKAVMAKQLTAQNAEIADLKAKVAQLMAMLEEMKNK